MKRILLLSLYLCMTVPVECMEKAYFGLCGKIYTIHITHETSGTTTKYKRRDDGTYTKSVKVNGKTIEKTDGFTEDYLRSSQEINGNKEMDTHFDEDDLPVE